MLRLPSRSPGPFRRSSPAVHKIAVLTVGSLQVGVTMGAPLPFCWAEPPGKSSHSCRLQGWQCTECPTSPHCSPSWFLRSTEAHWQQTVARAQFPAWLLWLRPLYGRLYNRWFPSKSFEPQQQPPKSVVHQQRFQHVGRGFPGLLFCPRACPRSSLTIFSDLLCNSLDHGNVATTASESSGRIKKKQTAQIATKVWSLTPT